VTWTGTGTPITSAAAPIVDCFVYASVADVRAAYGDDVAEMTDAQILRRLDALASELEGALGHTFGRAAIVSSAVADVLEVTAAALTIGGDEYLFADYATLGALAAAANGAGRDYAFDLLPQVNPITPSAYLKTIAGATVGPDYENRAVLCVSALVVQLTGEGRSHLFLPLPISTVAVVNENGTNLESTAYWALAGEPWLVKKLCGCPSTNSCAHPRGRWTQRYPGNIAVAYAPIGWGRPPGALRSLLVDAFGLQAGVGPGGLQSESFGGAYSYSQRAGAVQGTWQDALGGATVRQYSIRFQP